MSDPSLDFEEMEDRDVRIPARLFRALHSVAWLGVLFPFLILVTEARHLEGATGLSRYLWVGLGALVFSCLFYPVGMAYHWRNPKTRTQPPPSMRRYLALGIVCLVGLLLLAALRYEVLGR